MTSLRDIELLSPAGSFEAARAAVNAGADAIYMGGPYFSARAYSKSALSETDMLSDTIEYCKPHRVKVYLTLNTLIKEKEFGDICGYVQRYYDKGLSAVIIQDIGLLGLLKNAFPDLPVHISTQAGVGGRLYARELAALGADRIIAPRELSLDEISELRHGSGVDVEVFCHGAMCYCYSGQCLMSSYLGGRSGNRGRCAGTCRLCYEVEDKNGKKLAGTENGYVLSMKDLNTAARLAEMIKAGATSFKIEGRMKSPLYVAAVTHVYKKYLTEAKRLCRIAGREDSADVGNRAAPGRYGKEKQALTLGISGEDTGLLNAAYDRGGMSSGYLDGASGPEMIVFKEKTRKETDSEALGRIAREFVERDKKLPLDMKITIRKGRPVSLSISSDTASCSLEHTTVAEAAKGRPVTEQNVRERLQKLGDTVYELRTLETDMDDDCFIPLGSLNEIRRECLELLKKSEAACR